jgi:ATP-binding cassette subfamily F protein uup
VKIAYFDQQRAELDPERTVVDSVADGSDTVMVGGLPRHVHGYLEDFLFPPERARSPVKALSGGERNRLLLAKLLTRPANVLVLDEPTNDLDIETLELVESLLVDFPGTLLIVSHDRTFLDHVVTSTLVFEGDGRIEEYVGGYEDWQRHKAATAAALTAEAPRPAPARSPNAPRPAPKTKGAAKAKLSFKERREFDTLPDRIAALEAEDARLQTMLADANFYKESADAIKTTLARVDALRDELQTAYARWDELDSRE